MDQINTQKRKSLTCLSLGLYFAILPFDFLEVGSLGSVTRIVALFPIVFAIITNGRRWRIRKDSICRCLFLFVVLAAVSSVYSVSFDLTSDSLKSLIMNTLMVFIVGASVDYNEDEKDFLIKCLVFGSWVAVLMVVIFGTVQYGRTTIVIGETYQDPNYLCGYMFFALVYHLGEFFKKCKIIHLGLTAVIFIAVLMTGSRGAMLGVLACALACVILYGKDSGHTLKIIIIATIGITITSFVLYKFVFDRIDSVILSRFTRSYLEETGSTGRILIWAYLLNSFLHSGLLRQVFGNGYGTTIVINQVTLYGGKLAHNLYIDTLTTLGIVGCLDMIVLHVSCLIESKRSGNYYFFCAMIGYIALCMSMSLTSYKPLWATIMMILIFKYNPVSQKQMESKEITKTESVPAE